MKNIIAITLILAASAGGYWIGTRSQDATPGETSAGRGREILYWVAPMDPNYRRDEPGKSPMGMDLVPVYADEAAPQEGSVEISPAIANNLGVRTAPAEIGPLVRTIETVGYVQYDEESFSRVGTRVSGWIENLKVGATGEAVEAGELLLELYSPELVNAQQEYLAALRSGNQRLQTASRARLVSLGVSESEIRRLRQQRTAQMRQPVYAREAGIVARINARTGSYVTPATPILNIASLETVWVIAQVLQRQADWVSAGQAVQIQLDHLPGQFLHGVVDFVYPELDGTTRTLPVRIRLDNPDKSLRPNMFARVRIDTEPSAAVVHVPREAVIRGGRSDRVVVALGGGRFRAQPVITGTEAGDRVAILEGLDGNEQVVTSAQFLIDSEANIDAALARLQEPDSQAETVRVGAIIEGYRVAQSYITVDHEPIEAWSWPRMSMGFEVEDAALLDGLQLDQRVEIEIRRRGENDYVVTDIITGDTP